MYSTRKKSELLEGAPPQICWGEPLSWKKVGKRRGVQDSVVHQVQKLSVEGRAQRILLRICNSPRASVGETGSLLEGRAGTWAERHFLCVRQVGGWHWILSSYKIQTLLERYFEEGCDPVGLSKPECTPHVRDLCCPILGLC